MTDTAGTFTKTMQVTTGGSTYLPVSPTRVLDTRAGSGAPKAALAPDGTVAVDVTNGVAGIPAGVTVTAAVLNLTVTTPALGGYLTAWPDGSARPNTSNLSFHGGETRPNLVIVKVPADGKIDLYNGSAGNVQMIVDVAGYYTSGGGGAFVPVNPTRVMDTRKYIYGYPFDGHGIETWGIVEDGFADSPRWS